MKLYFFLGATGWWAKFILVINKLKNLDKNINVNGIIMAPGVENDIFSRYPKYKSLFDVQYELVKKFLKTKVKKSELTYYENKYGNLWKYVYAERRYLTFIYNKKFENKFYTHEELTKLIIGKFKYFEKVLSKTDVIITIPPASSWAYIMTAVALKMKKRIINIDQVGFPLHKAMLTESNKQIWTSVEKSYLNTNLKISKKNYNETKIIINNWRIKTKQDVPWLKLTDTQKYIHKYLNLKKISRYLFQLIKYLRGESIYIGSPFLILKQFLFFRLRDFKARYLFNYDKINEKEKYFYYPLHVEPEASLMINGIRGLNQISLIQRLAMQLPFDMKLYVKEHPTMVGWRLIKDYKLLQKIPNLKIINPNYNGKNLIIKSKGVFTVSGTSGWEALLLKKPVFLIGTSFYRKLPMVKYIQNIDNISNELNWLKFEYEHYENELIKFSYHIISDAIDLPFEYFWGISDDQDVFKKLKQFDHVTLNLAKKIFMLIK